MFKIKLLILLLSNLFFLSCTTNQQFNKNKLSVGYISGEYDGLLLSNLLESHLRNFNMLDGGSNYEIQASIGHSSNVFITNIDNTSDRERITSVVDIMIYNKILKCFSYTYSDSVSQFYIFAPSEKFISNKIAIEEIKYESTEYFVKNFINDISKKRFFICKNWTVISN